MDRIDEKGERRDQTARVLYMQKLNRIYAAVIIALSACMITLAGVFYQLNDYLQQREADRQVNRYLNCVQLYASGIEEQACEVYRDYIKRNDRK